MAVPSSIHQRIATKSMALVLILALTASFSHYAVAATGGAMGGGFAPRRDSRAASTSRYKDDYYSTRSGTGTAYVYRDNCRCSHESRTSPRQNGSVEGGRDSLFYAFLTFALIVIAVLVVFTLFTETRPMKSVIKLQVSNKFRDFLYYKIFELVKYSVCIVFFS
jgi:hypothetical protein